MNFVKKKNHQNSSIYFFHRPLEYQFILSCQYGELEEIQTILDEFKTKNIDINVQDINQKTGLHHAVENNHDSLVDFLLKNQADVNIADCNGNSVLHIAAMKGSIGITKILLEHGASKDLKNNAGKTTGDVTIEMTCLSGHNLVHTNKSKYWSCNSGLQNCKYKSFGDYGSLYSCVECYFGYCCDCYQLIQKNQIEIAKLLDEFIDNQSTHTTSQSTSKPTNSTSTTSSRTTTMPLIPSPITSASSTGVLLLAGASSGMYIFLLMEKILKSLNDLYLFENILFF